MTNVIKSRDQIRRVSNAPHPPRSAGMTHDPREAARKRRRWQRSQQPAPSRIVREANKLGGDSDREIVKHKRRVRRAQVIG